MLHSLYKYLVLNDHAGIPGIGTFSIKRGAAVMHRDTIDPPVQRIHFSHGTALTEKKFYQYLSSETGLSEVDAVRRFQDFAYQLRKDLQAHPQVQLTGLGILKRTPQGDIAFEPTVSVDQYFSSVSLKEVPRVAEAEDDHEILPDITDEEEVITTDRWWIWALVLTIVALAVIGYFYMQGDIF